MTNVIAATAAGQVVFIPQNTAFPTGVFLGVQAVVSADRRFVRLNLTPNLTNLTQSAAALFPITTFITPVFENGSQGLPIPFTQFLQQPTVQHGQRPDNGQRPGRRHGAPGRLEDTA